MRRVVQSVVVLGAFFISGCGRQAAEQTEESPRPLLAVNSKAVMQTSPQEALAAVQNQDVAQQEQFETALAEALKLLADGKQADALVALETAQAVQDSEFVRAEIAKLKTRIDQDDAAQNTVANLEAVLGDGKVEDAARIARDALKEFGGTDAAGRLVELRLQAEALQNAQKPEQAPARFLRFRSEADAAFKDKNLRGAALALEQALQSKDDADLRTQLEGVRATLDKYDRLREKAAQLRRDPAQIEDALAALEEAAQAWDTLQVRQDLDEYALALQKRRPRVSVAEFEVRGDVGIPDAGRSVADEILPALKAKYDLVEREQINKVVAELKLEDELANDVENQQQLGKLAKVQFLVLGSISRVAGLTVQARLVDVRTGLIVQTAKVTAATPEELMPLVAGLGKQLLLSDDEKIAFDQEMERQAQRPEPPAADAPLPPVPELPGADARMPAPVLAVTPVPPDAGGVKQDFFKQLPPPPAAGVALPPPVAGGAAEILIKSRLLQAVLQLGDNQFSRGNPHAARDYYSLALNLDPGNFDLRLRLTNCQALLPPPVVVVNPQVVRPRIAVLNFATYGNPLTVPPSLGTRAPQQLAPYLLSRYDVADPGEVYWYMAKMGLTLRDVMHDPFARRWLGRALNVRHFVVGNLVATASFDVNVYLIDAEHGFLIGQGRVHVRDPFELRLRMGELAMLVLMDPFQRTAYLTDDQRFQLLVAQGQQFMNRAAYGDALAAFTAALQIRPFNAQVQYYQMLARNQQQQVLWNEARRQQMLRQQALAAEATRRQWELARAAEAARLRPSQGIVVSVNLRQQAQTQLVSDARLALKVGNFSLGISTLRGALALAPNDDLYRELAVARGQAAKNAELAAAQARAQREAALRKQREQELAQARQQIDRERQRTQGLFDAQRKAQDERDRLAYQSAFDEGQRLLAKGNYDGAVASLQTARRMRKTDAVEALLTHAMVEQAKASAQKKGEKARQELDRQLALERQRRLQAETDAKRNQELYQAALRLAQQALADKNYQVAQAKYEEAGKLFKTDVVLTGLKQTQVLRQKSLDNEQKTARLQKLLGDGQAALDANKYGDAAAAFGQARKLAPDNVDALTGLTKAQDLRDKAQSVAKRQADEGERQRNFQRLLRAGQDNLKNKQHDAAVLALTEAVKLNPKDETARAALLTAEKARGADVASQAEFKKKAAAYQKLLGDGKSALAGKRFDDAISAFASAQKLLPGDKASADYLEDARKAKQDRAVAAAAAATAAKKKADELLVLKQQQLKADALKKHLGDTHAAIKSKDFKTAAQALAAATKLAPQDAAVLQAQSDLDAARQATAGTEKKKVEEQLRQAEYQRLVKQGGFALQGKRFAEAQKAFADALKLVPNDPFATRGYQTATKELTPAKVNPMPDAKALYQKEIQEAELATKQGKYKEAVQNYQDALKIMPKDAKATQGLRSAQFSLHYSEGQKDLNAGRFQEAVRHFEAALELAPNNPTVQKMLAKAKQGKK